MFEKVNPSHPDKIADRIAGAIVDIAYESTWLPRIAVEVLIGHGKCHIIAETSVTLDIEKIASCVERIAGDDVFIEYREFNQDPILAGNQSGEARCGDNGIFKGVPATEEQQALSKMVRILYEQYPTDGKYILDGNRLIACQSCMKDGDLDYLGHYYDLTANPLGYWTGGTDVDTGATNRKLGSDMGDAVTGGGLHGKDLSKADVSVNICCHLLAEEMGEPVVALCAIGDTEVTFRRGDGSEVDTVPYSEVMKKAEEYVDRIGGFEHLAEWGLI